MKPSTTIDATKKINETATIYTSSIVELGTQLSLENLLQGREVLRNVKTLQCNVGSVKTALETMAGTFVKINFLLIIQPIAQLFAKTLVSTMK
jgi:hypothetical protein